MPPDAKRTETAPTPPTPQPPTTPPAADPTTLNRNTKHETPNTPQNTPPQTSNRPTAEPPDFRAIPDALARIPRWVTWRYEQGPDGSWTKSFFRPGYGRAVFNDFRSWSTFHDVQVVYERRRHTAGAFDGIAFAVGGGFAAVELNDIFPTPNSSPAPEGHGLDPQCPRQQAPPSPSPSVSPSSAPPPLIPSSHHPLTGEAVPPSLSPSVPPSSAAGEPYHWALTLIHDLKTYTQLTPDGRALLLIVNGPLNSHLDDPTIEPTPHPEGGTFAIYNQPGRHICITGRKWRAASSYAVEDREPRLRQIARQLRQGTKLETLYPGAPPPPPPPPPAPPRTDQGISWRAINPFAGVPTMAELRAKQRAEARLARQKAEELRLRDWRPEDSPPPKTREQIEAERARHRRYWRMRKHPNYGPPKTDEILKLAFDKFILARTPAGEPFAVEREGPNIARKFRGGDDPFSAWLNRCVIRDLGRAAHPAATNTAQALLQAEALGAPIQEIHLRVASLPVTPARGAVDEEPIEEQPPQTTDTDTAPSDTSPESTHKSSFTNHDSYSLAIDLGHSDGRTVIVSAEGWHITDRSPVPFYRTKLTRELPLPERGGTLDDLRPLINVSDESWPLLCAWLVASFIPSIPHPILLLRGVEGAGKTTALRFLSCLIDPSSAQLRQAPDNSERWARTAASSWCVAVDDVASISPWFGKALGNAVHGDGFDRRSRSAADDLAVLEARRVIALGSDDLRPGRNEPFLVIDMEPIADDCRLPPTELRNTFQQLRPRIFAALLDEVAALLRHLPDVRLPPIPGLDEFAKVAAAFDLAHDVQGAAAAQPPAPDRKPSMPNTPPSTPDMISSAPDMKTAAQVGSDGCAGQSTSSRTAPHSGAVADTKGRQSTPSATRNTKHETPNTNPDMSPAAPDMNPSAPDMKPPAPDMKNAIQDVSDVSDMSKHTPSRAPLQCTTNNRPPPPSECDPNPMRPPDAGAPPRRPPSTARFSALQMYLQQRHRLAVEVVENDDFGDAIVELVRVRGSWHGTAAELLLAIDAKSLGRNGPKGTRNVGRLLRKLTQPLLANGVAVEFDRETNSSRRRQISLSSSARNQ